MVSLAPFFLSPEVLGLPPTLLCTYSFLLPALILFWTSSHFLRWMLRLFLCVMFFYKIKAGRRKEIKHWSKNQRNGKTTDKINEAKDGSLKTQVRKTRKKEGTSLPTLQELNEL